MKIYLLPFTISKVGPNLQSADLVNHIVELKRINGYENILYIRPTSVAPNSNHILNNGNLPNTMVPPHKGP
jgi:hypothetical protein